MVTVTELEFAWVKVTSLDAQFLVARTRQAITKDQILVKKAAANINIFFLDGILAQRSVFLGIQDIFFLFLSPFSLETVLCPAARNSGPRSLYWQEVYVSKL